MPQTLWTLIMAARDASGSGQEAALARLCEIYWHPLYAFVCRQHFTPHQAEDLTQAFFEQLFERAWLDGVDRQKGRFRSFLLCALSNFLNSERAKQRALKRGGSYRELLSLDQPDCGEVPDDSAMPAPSLEFARDWACALVNKAMDDLEHEYRRCHKLPLFHVLSPFMARPVPEGFYDQQSSRLNMTEGALRVAMHRIIRRFGELLRAQVASTVASPELIEDELREVIQAWARS